MNPILPWKKVGTRKSGQFRVFDVRTDLKVSPRTGETHEFFVIEAVNWVNVIAVTRDQRLVMVEQYRHGSETVELEIPGGMMDPGETSPVATGVRELAEETGYEGSSASLIGQIFPNPAIMNNICYTVLVQDCELKHSLKFDSTEDIATRLVPLAEIPQLVRSGKIQHSLVAVALYHYELSQRA